MQRIKSLTLENFKFFYGDRDSHPKNTLEINKNNVLIFGENGSGKSSIYWALYTFLQSVLKDNPSKIDKYFTPNGSQNLRNRFCEDVAYSGVEIIFEDELEGTTSRKICLGKSNTKSGNLVKKTLDSSDFINYKYLSKIYDFRNSEPIDLFPMFEKEVLMFIDLGEEYRDHNNNLSGKTYASDWWEFISISHLKLPKNKNTISESSEEYRRYKYVTIPRFIELLKRFLLEITESANYYLETEFKENYSINFKVETINCDFNKKRDGMAKSKDGKLYPPKIPLELNFNHQSLSEPNKVLSKPHTFLNEARLTAIALAIRLAMLDLRPKFEDTASILVLDDLLLSLDMSHRNIVLDIMLKKVSDFQIIMLTHDKLFFEMARHKIKTLKQNDWEYIEMYSTEKDDIPQPLIYKSNSYLGKAKMYLDKKEYEIAGNFLRKEAEQFCKNLLPKKYKLNDEGRVKLLSGLLQGAITFAESEGLNKALFDELDSYREFILNAASHDSYDVPKFKSEIEKCIETLEQLNKIEIKSEVLKKNDELQISMNCDDGSNWVFNIVLHDDDFRLIQEPGKDLFLSRGHINFKMFKDGIEQPPKGKNVGDWFSERASLKHKFDTWFEKSDKKGIDNYWDGITFIEDGRPLRTII
ncbi:MAG: AAA family ATPase [Flavobacterium sp.]|uniref:AAA family ATPase n=1 Tax=Flavobacterium sp. TaxID=239 RepID=UPI0039198A14